MYGDNSADRIFFNLYVPISNPVDTCTPSKNNNNNDQTGHVTYMMRPRRLCNNPLEDGQADSDTDCYDRQHCSYNWVEYFINRGIARRTLSSDIDMKPWVLFYSKRNQKRPQSINYAWYSAITTHQCTDANSDPTNVTCDQTKISNVEQSIYEAQDNYRTNQNKNSHKKNLHLRNKLIIPGAQKQLSMFFHDFRNKPPTPETRCTLYGQGPMI